MDSPDQVPFTLALEASSFTSLLRQGIVYARQGQYIEGAIFFAHARERLSSDYTHLASALDTFLQVHARYLQAQQLLHTASKRFAEADFEQQTLLVALEKLLFRPGEEVDLVPQPCAATESVRGSCARDALQRVHLPSIGSNIEQPLQPPPPLPGENDILPPLNFTCFGRFEVRRLGQPIPVCANRSGQSILRYLVAQPNHCATSDTLQTLIWPEDQPEVALNKLHIAISALRRSLNHGFGPKPTGGYIVHKDRAYYLNPAVAIQTDVDEFLHYYHSGRQAMGEREALYEKACRIYIGPFLVEDIYAGWSFLQREELSGIYLAMCSALADYYLHNRCYDNAAQWTTAILKENNCDEAAHRQLMQIYAAQGRRSQAIQQYHRCKLVLHEELGVQPLPETSQIFQTLLANGQSSNQ